MFSFRQSIFTAMILAVTFSATAVRADNQGQEDLDKATEAKLSATTISDLGEVIRLLESALQKGLNKSNSEFANKMLASALAQRGTAVAAALFRSGLADPRWPQFRQVALGDLEKSLQLDPKQPQALLLVARLNLLPEGDEKRAKETLNRAIEFAADDNRLRANALAIRAGTQEKLEDRLPDLNEAIRLMPDDAVAIRMRGTVLADLERYDDALADLNKAIELDPNSAPSYEVKAIVLTRMKNYDQALETLDQAQKLVPNSIGPWLQKTRIHSLQKKLDNAIEDLNHAVAIDVGNVNILLLRASLYQEKGDKEKALADVEEALRLRPNFPVALRSYASILADMGKSDKALEQLEKLRQLDPNDPLTALQIGLVYIMQKQSAKAIEVYSRYLQEHPDEAGILRARADAYLNVGKQTEAIADYEKAFKELSKDSGLLNNLAWVLATSPDEKLRDGPRAIKLATEACQLTAYNQAHILSTLAAAYAETGDFENARKWSAKAVELGGKEHLEQMKKELESYRDNKPWREVLSEKEPASDEETSAKTEEKSAQTEEPPPAAEKKPAQPEAASPKPEEPGPKTEVLFNGKNLDGWTLKPSPRQSNWTVGHAQVDPQNQAGLIVSYAGGRSGELVNLEGRGVDIYSVPKFSDGTFELEFMIPKDSNSGVYVMGEYEVQIFDSFGKTDLGPGDLGAIYGAAVPKLNAAKAPGQWQTLLIQFQAPRFENGRKTANARFLKVTLNGQLVHENVEMKGPTPGGLTGKEAPEGPLMFQGDHGPVAYRNIKFTPAGAEK
jgi:tetratricopeptide (TPR) repeat protein